MKYEKVTKENFEAFTDKYVSKEWRKRFIGLDMPKNENEFKQFTEAIYGVELGVDCLAYPKGSFTNRDGFEYKCKYEITGMTQDEYAKNPIMKLWDKKYGQYDGLKVLLDTCFGELICGGVATYHYGQTRCDKETWDRVKAWDDNNDGKLLKSAIEQHNSLVEIFGHNPFQ